MFTMLPAAIQQAASTPVDPFFADVVSLLHLNTNFFDQIGKTWAANGGTAISTSHPKFGTGSLNVGGSVGPTTNAGITTPSSTDFDFGTGDFTIDWQQYWTSFADFQNTLDRGGTASGALLLETGSGDGKIIVYMGGSVICSESSAPTLNAWHQYQLKRAGTTVTVTRDGAVTATGSSSANLGLTAAFCWGAYASGANATASYIDEARITKGVARTYATQTAPWPDA